MTSTPRGPTTYVTGHRGARGIWPENSLEGFRRVSALDVDAIRKIDLGRWTANEAFQHAGVNFSLPEAERIPAVAMFAAMECAALLMLNNRASVALAGSLAPVIAPEVRQFLGRDVAVYDEWCASRGLVRIARDVFSGSREILGLDIDL